MGVVTGTSVKGLQSLIFETGPLYNVAVRVLPGFPLEGKYKGFLSIEVFNGFNYYQAAGRSLWYEGVLLFLPPEFRGTPYVVVATWREAGLDWEVVTY